jgi:hypothetical protein
MSADIPQIEVFSTGSENMPYMSKSLNFTFETAVNGLIVNVNTPAGSKRFVYTGTEDEVIAAISEDLGIGAYLKHTTPIITPTSGSL